MSEVNKVIQEMFSVYWSGDLSEAPVADMRKQLHKNLSDQLNGYWSGHTAYYIMTRGGFLVDSKRITTEGNKCKPKELTHLGKEFMRQMSEQDKIAAVRKEVSGN